MKKPIIIILILFFYSCSQNIDLKGDWRATKLVIDNSREVDVPQFPITYFKDDNYIIYFESIYRYEIQKDSIAFYFGDDPDKLNYKTFFKSKNFSFFDRIGQDEIFYNNNYYKFN